MKYLIFCDDFFLEKYLLVENIHNNAVTERFRQYENMKTHGTFFLKEMYNIC